MADSATSTTPLARKYSVDEINAMRRSLRAAYPSGVAYYEKERSAEVEDRLRTHMQNGTEPSELEEAANKHFREEAEAQEVWRMWRSDMRAKAPPPRVLVTAEDVIDEWFQTSVARYDGASVTAKELYDGFSGVTLTAFANRHAPDGINITQRDMENYLDRKGVKSRSAMFAKRYDGIRHIMHGNVRSGNYGT